MALKKKSTYLKQQKETMQSKPGGNESGCVGPSDVFLCPQGRCYNGECKTRDNQCQHVWGTSKSCFPAWWLHVGFSAHYPALPVLLKTGSAWSDVFILF